MVIAKIYRSYDGRITGFDISGHSGYDQWGRDIVCAGVSAVAQTALIGLLRHLPIQPDYNQDDAYLRGVNCLPVWRNPTGKRPK